MQLEEVREKRIEPEGVYQWTNSQGNEEIWLLVDSNDRIVGKISELQPPLEAMRCWNCEVLVFVEKKEGMKGLCRRCDELIVKELLKRGWNCNELL